MDSFTMIVATFFPAQAEDASLPTNEESPGGSGGQAYCVVA